MIDSHCHFDFPPFTESPETWIERSLAAGVRQLIVPAVSTENWERVATLAEAFPEISYAVGLHPVWMSSHEDADIQKLDTFLADAPKGLVAVGECGLDFAIENADPERQIRLLTEQLKLAEKYQLPVILHSRKAHNELLQLLNDFPKVKGILHAFSGSEQIGREYIKRGFLLGIGGTITYQRANKTRNAVRNLPLSNLVLETDAPDMPVYGYQGEPNLPERLPLIAQALASLKGVNIEKVIHVTTQNSTACFALNV
ncbi:TatD family hydrolase [Grimontia sp. NTOU-MAR1]|uniref:TatD family hydrolase n=1 Tax=Grimontia sp. NTOU-MAR1 TaxID=3111011 RepID=UPI002DB9F1E6|nr:TatD family hydrolase [Grimontia sp. NTOU-MAR1]WRV99332.1 TatD family hydrolase [Grimontia sp. NTOU-MAR1]